MHRPFEYGARPPDDYDVAMRTMVLRGLGAPDGAWLRLEDVPDVQPPPGHVLIDVTGQEGFVLFAFEQAHGPGPGFPYLDPEFRPEARRYPNGMPLVPSLLKTSKIAYLAWSAWHDADKGAWPVGLPESAERAYDLAEIKKWLELFLKRFFANQFKRSAVPNGPKISSGGALSPRGDWRMPSDATADAWLAELAAGVPD